MEEAQEKKEARMKAIMNRQVALERGPQKGRVNQIATKDPRVEVCMVICIIPFLLK